MSRLDRRRREVMPSREISGRRSGPSFGPRKGVSVPISMGLPLLVVGAFLVFTAIATDRVELWIAGAVLMIAGAVLMASGKRL
jgi:hypothetical protein